MSDLTLNALQYSLVHNSDPQPRTIVRWLMSLSFSPTFLKIIRKCGLACQ